MTLSPKMNNKIKKLNENVSRQVDDVYCAQIPNSHFARNRRVFENFVYVWSPGREWINNVLCILTYIELQRNFLFHWWNTVWIQMCKGVNKISPQKWVLYQQVELSLIQSKRGDKFYLFFLIVNIAGGFLQIIAVIRAEIQIDTNLAVVR